MDSRAEKINSIKDERIRFEKMGLKWKIDLKSPVQSLDPATYRYRSRNRSSGLFS
jgi:hypothetical protein